MHIWSVIFDCLQGNGKWQWQGGHPLVTQLWTDQFSPPQLCGDAVVQHTLSSYYNYMLSKPTLQLTLYSLFLFSSKP